MADLPLPPSPLPPGSIAPGPGVSGPDPTGAMTGPVPVRGRAPVAARPGRLTPAWRLVFGVAWAMVVLAYVAVWTSSRTIGLGTWWLGSASDPQPLPVRLVPFVPALVAIAATARNTAATVPIGLVASVVLAAIGAADLATYPRFAVVELAIAGSAALVGLAALGGRSRRGPAAGR